jgi:hypothetical protein
MAIAIPARSEMRNRLFRRDDPAVPRSRIILAFEVVATDKIAAERALFRQAGIRTVNSFPWSAALRLARRARAVDNPVPGYAPGLRPQ